MSRTGSALATKRVSSLAHLRVPKHCSPKLSHAVKVQNKLAPVQPVKGFDLQALIRAFRSQRKKRPKQLRGEAFTPG